MRTLRRYLILLALAAPCTTMAQGPSGAEDGFISMFNGRDLSGWHDAEHWLVEDGVLHCTGERGGPGWL
ncbi:MAG: family 16 glycoside hydrolase, partial [Armatimonadota bacterium]